MKKKTNETKKTKMDKSQLFGRIMALILAGMMALSAFATLIFAIIYG